ncbi:START-like domain-containing protein [Artemisia annua]|uniref:START-like domain-containing protein n=2 Tax=Artemisia annua TaxID=35608 RepID=A0A2U1M1T1_ARTAN|nr:START-like domain-containing protein [Artemisia annua]
MLISKHTLSTTNHHHYCSYHFHSPTFKHSVSFPNTKPNTVSTRGRRYICMNSMNGMNNERLKNEISAEEVVLNEEGGRKRKVKCEVEVISWRERRVKSQVEVDADVESVWTALTDYERLADFIPNLIFSARIPCAHPGRIWLEQRGLQRALYWHIEARVVLDLQELPNSANGRELHFSMVDGDFKKFEGKWSVKPGRRSTTTILSYEVNVIPNFNIPAIFMERIIRSDLPVNLQAIARRSERSFEGNENTSTEVHSAATSAASNTLDIDSTIEKNIPTVASKPIAEVNNKWGVFGKTCDIDSPCKVDEIHLRRFDGLLENGGVHRCVFASITVKAPVREVWNVLTSYETLPEIVPNLAISRILARDNNKVRILQEGCKGLLYMVLHARVVLDLCEHLEEEITFEQVEGDFDSFKGRWLFEQLGNHHTLLKYSVESKMQQGSMLSEAIMEEVIYEDLPSNLCAIRDYIEKKKAKDSVEVCNDKVHTGDDDIGSDIGNSIDIVGNENPSKTSSKGIAEKPSRRSQRVIGLHKDIEVLKSELLKFITEHGQEGFMPMRSQLRKHGRFDMEKAISRRGGFRKFASMMNLSLAYKDPKPKGYWDHLENLKEEISRFQKSWGMDPAYMPSRKSFERGGRYDIARALEKWGGLHEVSRLLSLKVRHPNRMRNNVNDGDKPPSTQDVSLDTEKWMVKLKDLDINWVE